MAVLLRRHVLATELHNKEGDKTPIPQAVDVVKARGDTDTPSNLLGGSLLGGCWNRHGPHGRAPDA